VREVKWKVKCVLNLKKIKAIKDHLKEINIMIETEIEIEEIIIINIHQEIIMIIENHL